MSEEEKDYLIVKLLGFLFYGLFGLFLLWLIWANSGAGNI
jgi:hypothetical protein